MAIFFLPESPNPSKSGRLRSASSTESSEKMVMSSFLPRLLELLPTVGLGSEAAPKNRLREAGNSKDSSSSHNRARFGRGSETVGERRPRPRMIGPKYTFSRALFVTEL